MERQGGERSVAAWFTHGGPGGVRFGMVGLGRSRRGFTRQAIIINMRATTMTRYLEKSPTGRVSLVKFLPFQILDWEPQNELTFKDAHKVDDTGTVQTVRKMPEKAALRLHEIDAIIARLKHEWKTLIEEQKALVEESWEDSTPIKSTITRS